MDLDGNDVFLIKDTAQRRVHLTEKVKNIDQKIESIKELLSEKHAEKERYLAELSTIVDEQTEEVDQEALH